MQASTITALTPNNTASNNGKPAIAPEFAFDKILTREIGDRSSPTVAPPSPGPVKSQAPTPPANQNSQHNNKLEAKQAAKNNSSPAPAKNAEKPETADASQTDTANLAKGEPSPNAVDDKGTETEASTSSASTGSSQILPGSAMPVDMLALVASFNQVANKPVASTTSNLPQASLGLGNSKVQDSLQALGNTPLSSNLNTDATTIVADPAAQNPQAFAAIFDQAALAGKVTPTVQGSEILSTKSELSSDKTSIAEPELASLVESGKASLQKIDASPSTPSTAKAPVANSELMPKINELSTTTSGKLTADASSLMVNNKIPENLIPPSMVAPLAQVNAQFSQIAAVKANERVAPMVGSEGWDSAVGQKMVWMVAAGQQSAELTLNPPDMGPMQVVLKISNDEASVSFSAAQPEVRQALEAALPKLREMMNEAGVNLTSSTVSTSLPHQQSGNTGSGEKNGNGSGPQANGNMTGEETGGQLASQPIRRVSAGLGAVDTFA